MPALADRKVKHYCGLYRRKLAEYEAMMCKLREIAGCDVTLENNNKRPHWMDEIVKPLAAALGKVLGKPVVVMGPFGICCNVSLSVEGCRGNGLEFQPHGDCTELYLVDVYSNTGKYGAGSLGEVNGMNRRGYPAGEATLQELADAMRSVRGLRRLIKKLQQLEASARKRP